MTITLKYAGQSLSCNYQLAGEHNIANAAAAAACAIAVGVSLEHIAHGLAAATPVAGRLNFIKLASGITLIDDTYNANPASTQAAIDVLGEFEGERYMVLGDLLELGEKELPADSAVLVKGSRSMKMEVVVAGVADQLAATPAGACCQ